MNKKNHLHKNSDGLLSYDSTAQQPKANIETQSNSSTTPVNPAPAASTVEVKANPTPTPTTSIMEQKSTDSDADGKDSILDFFKDPSLDQIPQNQGIDSNLTLPKDEFISEKQLYDNRQIVADEDAEIGAIQRQLSVLQKQLDSEIHEVVIQTQNIRVVSSDLQSKQDELEKVHSETFQDKTRIAMQKKQIIQKTTSIQAVSKALDISKVRLQRFQSRVSEADAKIRDIKRLLGVSLAALVILLGVGGGLWALKVNRTQRQVTAMYMRNLQEANIVQEYNERLIAGRFNLKPIEEMSLAIRQMNDELVSMSKQQQLGRLRYEFEVRMQRSQGRHFNSVIISEEIDRIRGELDRLKELSISGVEDEEINRLVTDLKDQYYLVRQDEELRREMVYLRARINALEKPDYFEQLNAATRDALRKFDESPEALPVASRPREVQDRLDNIYAEILRIQQFLDTNPAEGGVSFAYREERSTNIKRLEELQSMRDRLESSLTREDAQHDLDTNIYPGIKMMEGAIHEFELIEGNGDSTGAIGKMLQEYRQRLEDLNLHRVNLEHRISVLDDQEPLELSIQRNAKKETSDDEIAIKRLVPEEVFVIQNKIVDINHRLSEIEPLVKEVERIVVDKEPLNEVAAQQRLIRVIQFLDLKKEKARLEAQLKGAIDPGYSVANGLQALTVINTELDQARARFSPLRQRYENAYTEWEAKKEKGDNVDVLEDEIVGLEVLEKAAQEEILQLQKVKNILEAKILINYYAQIGASPELQSLSLEISQIRNEHQGFRTDTTKEFGVNEDAGFVDPNLGLMVVADGVGGGAYGDVVSQMLVDGIKRAINKEKLASFSDLRSLLAYLKVLVYGENKKIVSYNDTQSEIQGKEIKGAVAFGMSLIWKDPQDGKTKLIVLNKGDTRFYQRKRDGRVIQLSKDDSYVQALLEAGEISAEEAESHEHRNVITDLLGHNIDDGLFKAHQTIVTDLDEGDFVFGLTDGVWGLLGKAGIEQIAGEEINNPDSLASDLFLESKRIAVSPRTEMERKLSHRDDLTVGVLKVMSTADKASLAVSQNFFGRFFNNLRVMAANLKTKFVEPTSVVPGSKFLNPGFYNGAIIEGNVRQLPNQQLDVPYTSEGYIIIDNIKLMFDDHANKWYYEVKDDAAWIISREYVNEVVRTPGGVYVNGVSAKVFRSSLNLLTGQSLILSSLMDDDPLSVARLKQLLPQDRNIRGEITSVIANYRAVQRDLAVRNKKNALHSPLSRKEFADLEFYYEQFLIGYGRFFNDRPADYLPELREAFLNAGRMLNDELNDLRPEIVVQASQNAGKALKLSSANAAQISNNVGGINLSDENMTLNIKVDGSGMPLPMQYQENSMKNLNGLISVIRSIVPVSPNNLPALYSLIKTS